MSLDLHFLSGKASLLSFQFLRAGIRDDINIGLQGSWVVFGASVVVTVHKARIVSDFRLKRSAEMSRWIFGELGVT